MSEITIITRERLSAWTMRKYGLTGGKRVLLNGYEYWESVYPEPSDNLMHVARVFSYRTEITGKKVQRLTAGRKYLLDGKEAYWFEERNWKIWIWLLVLLLVIPLTVVIIWSLT